MIQASMNTKSDFWRALEWIAMNYRMDNLLFNDPPHIVTTEGRLGITGPEVDPEYPDEGEFIRVGFVLHDGMYAEIDDNTYGTLNAIRIYKEVQ